MRLTTQTLVFFLLIATLLFTPLSMKSVADDIIPTDLSQLPHQQELLIPIPTDNASSIYQPIDIRIIFEQNCWAQNETIHSVRVSYDDGSGPEEIESQIYDLSHTDDTHIDACSLVFLIPPEANGDETYTVHYSDQTTDPSCFPDHLSIIDTHYYYEPITAQIIDFDYYRVIEDEYIIYAICQKGELLGNGMSNAIIKLLPNSTVFTTTSAEQIASFYMSYSTNPSGTHTGTQWATDVEKQVLVDGNLMIRLKIQGVAPDDEIITDNIYTYYYCPTSEKHLHVNVNHEVLEDIEVQGTQEREGTYASLSTIKARSATIEDMNLGEILPTIHVYSEDNTIKEYEITTDPNVDPAEWLLSAEDDQDLGDDAWFCIDEESSGRAHGLIFESNTGILDGPDDGIQVKASVKQHVKLPGLEADSGDLYALRNAYEDGTHLTRLTEGTIVNFNVQYIALQTGGYQAIEQEAPIYQTLIKDRPIVRGNETFNEPEPPTERYSLTGSVHLAPSFPLGSLLSAATGRNISYLTAELYKDGEYSSSGAIGRLKIGDIDIDAEGASFRETLAMIANVFDLRNSSLFKTFRFTDIEPGSYLVKIYRENPFFGSERQYIGYAVVDVTEDTKTRITCKTETAISTTVTDQSGDPVESIDLYLFDEDTTIAMDTTDEEGSAYLPLPYYRNTPFQLKSYYKGFLIDDTPISLSLRNRNQPVIHEFDIERYSCFITVTDTLGLAPAVNVNPLLTSNQMAQSKSLQPDRADQNTVYDFYELYPASYKLKMSYKSFILEETITVNKDTSVAFEFPAEFPVEITINDRFGTQIDTAKIMVTRQGKRLSTDISNGKGSLIMPPGTYQLSIRSDEDTIAQQDITVKGDQSLDILSNKGSILHLALPILIFLFIGGFVVYLYRERQMTYIIPLLVIAFVLSSLFFPWWTLTGEESGVSTTTNTMLIPARLVTLTTTSSVIGGDISSVPEEFTMVLSLLVYIVVATTLVLFLGMILKQRYPRIHLILRMISLLLTVVPLVLFYVAMSEVTKVGVGSFWESGEIPITIPGQTEQVSIICHWGPGIGFYLLFAGLLLLLLWQARQPLQKLLVRYQVTSFFRR